MPAAAASGSDSSSIKDDGCRLYELVQYHCSVRPERIVCQPVERILRRCPGRPSVDVTHVVATDRLGNVYLPKDVHDAMPPSNHWDELK